MKCIVLVFALALVMAMPAFASDPCTYDPTALIVFSDCSQITVSSCYCEVASGEDGLPVHILDDPGDAAPGTPATDGSGDCVNTGPNIAATTYIFDIEERQGQFTKGGNGTPGKKSTGGKKFITIECATTGSDQCPSDNPDDTSDADLGPFQNKKTAHGTVLVYTDDGDTLVAEVGINFHTNTCDP